MSTGRVALVPFVVSKLTSRARHHIITSLLSRVSPQIASNNPDHYLASLAMDDFIRGSSEAYKFLNRKLASPGRQDLKDVVSSSIWQSIVDASASETENVSKNLDFVDVTASVVDGRLPEMFRRSTKFNDLDNETKSDDIPAEFPSEQTVSFTVRFHSEVILGEADNQVLHRRIDDLEFSSRVDQEVSEWKITAIN